MRNIPIIIFTVTILLFACNNERKPGEAVKESADSSANEKATGTATTDTATTGIVIHSPGKFHKMLARSIGVWIGEATMQFAPGAAPVNAGTSVLTNTMSTDGLYQISEINGNIYGVMGKPWTGLRITGYDSLKKVFTRAMIGDSPSISSAAMEGPWDEATQSITMPFKRADPSTGKERNLKEVYRIIDENTEVLEIHTTDPTTKKEFKMLNVKWTRKK